MVGGRLSTVILLYCSLNFILVEGVYIIQTQLHDYDIPNQQLWSCGFGRCSKVCCDAGEGNCTSGDRRCDTFFVFCLKPLDTSSSDCSSDSDPSIMQSDVNENDATIDFSQSTFLGLNNPLSLPGLTNDWNHANSVQLHITVRDKDNGSSSQIIGTFIFNLLGVPVNSSHNRYKVGFFATINVTIGVLCAENFRGSDCTQCIPGFTGTMCDVNIDDCLEETCSGNGQCVDGINTFTCNCNPGFTGMECQNMTLYNINECLDPGVCSGNGACVDEVSSYSCNCSAGYTGANCEINIDDCSSNPCGANGQCFDGVNSFTCNCSTGYTGTLCDIDIDKCLSNPCGRNGVCMNQERSFSCICDLGFTGDLCQTNIDKCIGVNCSGNGVCLDGVNTFTCQCNPGFRGILCAEEIQDSSVQADPIVGGVLGILLLLTFILVISVVVVVLIMRCLNLQGKKNVQEDSPRLSDLSDNCYNPVYDNLSSNDSLRDDMGESAPERVFNNPIYIRNGEDTDNVYADPDTSHQTGNELGSSPYHEFDNPVYGTSGELLECTHSTLATRTDTASSTGQKSTNREALAIGSEQVYEHVN